MKARCIVLALAATFSAHAVASDDIIGDLAQESGLSTRQVKMLVGARSGHAAYLASFDQVERKFVASVGQERYRALLAQDAAPAGEAPEAARLAQVDRDAATPEG